MEEITMLEPFELFNLLNQHRGLVSRLAEINYLCLIDARESHDYKTNHIKTAKNAKMDSGGTFLPPESVEFDSMQHIVVYDDNTSSVQDLGRAVQCAQVLTKTSLHPVHIVTGGFQRFSALYTFLRTEKILYTIRELENLKVYPVEIIPGLLYMGDHNQSLDTTILKDLKIRLIIDISPINSLESRFALGCHITVNLPIEDSVTSDLYSSLERICRFISSHVENCTRVLIVSKGGRSRCSAMAIAFLMHHTSDTLKEAWQYMLKCKPTMRPNMGFLQQLSEWELHIRGAKVTNISDHCF